MAVCTYALPVAKFDASCPNALFGQIKKLYWTRPGDALTAVSSLTEWNTRLSNTTVLPASPTLAPIRSLPIIGSLPEPEKSEVEVSLGRYVYTKPKYRIPFSIDEITDENVALVRDQEQNPARKHTFWIETEAGQLFGGNSGFSASFKLALVIPEGKSEIQKIVGELKWEGYLPSHIATPFV